MLRTMKHRSSSIFSTARQQAVSRFPFTFLKRDIIPNSLKSLILDEGVMTEKITAAQALRGERVSPSKNGSMLRSNLLFKNLVS